MAEFWEQQLMDRLLTLCFNYKKSEKDVIPKEEMMDVIDYVKFLLNNQEITEEHNREEKL